MQPKPSIGIIGAGRLGTAVARQSLAAGYGVRIANSKAPETLDLILSVLLPGAIASTVPEVILNSDIIILAIPLRQYRTLPADLFKNKIVIDAMNYWAPVEGHIDEFANAIKTSSELVQDYLQNASVVKSLNHVAYNELEEHATQPNSAKRRAIAMASDNNEAKNIVGTFIDAIGFDAVDFGPLKNGSKFQPDTILFNTRLTTTQLQIAAQK